MGTVITERRHAVRKNSSSHCPFIHTFSPGCYCTEMKSTRVEDAIYYCGGDYIACPVYNELNKDIKAAFKPYVSEKGMAIGL